jgi:hypothetical protein
MRRSSGLEHCAAESFRRLLSALSLLRDSAMAESFLLSALSLLRDIGDGGRASGVYCRR